MNQLRDSLHNCWSNGALLQVLVKVADVLGFEIAARLHALVPRDVDVVHVGKVLRERLPLVGHVGAKVAGQRRGEVNAHVVVQGYLVKPVDGGALLGKISELLN